MITGWKPALHEPALRFTGWKPALHEPALRFTGWKPALQPALSTRERD